MNLTILLIVLVAAILLVAVLVVLRRQSRSTPDASKNGAEVSREPTFVNNTNVSQAREPAQAERIGFGPEGSPFVTIEAWRREMSIRTEPCHLPEATREHLSQLLAGAPTAALAGYGVASQVGTYLLSFAPVVQAGLSDGSLKLVEAAGGGWRAMATDGSRIAGQGTLTKVGPSVASMGFALWAIAALVTAQKYLADIDRRLRVIESAVERMQMWSEHSIRAHIEADTRYLRDLFCSIRDGEMGEASLQNTVAQLETIDREISRKVVELQRRLGDLVGSVENIKINIGKLSGGTLKAQRYRLERQAREAGRWLTDLVAALHVKSVAAQLRCGLPGDAGFSRRRVTDLRADIENTAQLLQRLRVALSKRAEELVGGWTRAGTKREAQEAVRSVLNQSVDHVDAYIEGATEAAAQLDVMAVERIVAAGQPVQLVVEIGENGVKSCRRVVHRG